jgi:hypothetical protein
MPGAVKLRSGSIAPLIDQPQGVASTNISMNSPGATNSRAIWRSARKKGEMNATIVMSPLREGALPSLRRGECSRRGRFQ